MLIDTHCHIHDSEFYGPKREAVYERAIKAGVEAMICVGTSHKSSVEAIDFAREHTAAYAAIGVHPHDTRHGWDEIAQLPNDVQLQKIVAVGEIGLDYFYDNSPRDVQVRALESQLQLAHSLRLPVIFHVREAFDDFWPIVDNFSGLQGVLHSFTDTIDNLEQALSRNFYIGVNGISTFTKDEKQQVMYDAVPVEQMLLETDAPFLAPVSRRGQTNQPAFIREIAEYHAVRRHKLPEEIIQHATDNARRLFPLN